jgi:cytochrome c oxidase subunit 3
MEIPFTVKARPDTGLYNAKVGIWLFLASEVMLFGALFSSYILLRVGAAPGTWPHGLLNIPLGTLNTLVLITSSVTVVLSWASLKLNNFPRYRLYQGITILCALIFLGIKSFEYRDKFTHYYVKLANGTEMTGHLTGATDSSGAHLPGSPLFWNNARLAGNPKKNQKPITEIEFHPDADHKPATASAAEAHAPAKAEGAAPAAAEHGEHEAMKIKKDEILKLECFGPFHSTYLAIYFTLTALHGLHVAAGAFVIFMIWGPLAGLWKTDPARYTNRIEVSGLFWHFVDLVWIFLFPVLYLL